MAISTRFIVAATAAVLTSSGCGTLIRAVKGELTPIGADKADSGDVSKLGSTLASTDDPNQFAAAFTDLTSVYLYKCMDAPTKVPRDGKPEIRTRAGQALLAGVGQRIPAHGTDDPLLAEVGPRLDALRAQVEGKCDAGKLGGLDPDGKLAQAITLMTPRGRSEQVATFEAELDASLRTALAADDHDLSLRRWVTKTCPSVLPDDTCATRAIDAAYAEGDWDSLVGTFLSGSDAFAPTVLPGLAERHGADEVTEQVKAQLLGDGALPGYDRGLTQMATWLRAQDAWGSCDDRTPAFTRMLTTGDEVTASWAIDQIVADACHELDGTIVKALGSDLSVVRRQAAWAIGELRITKGKRHLERLQWSDPYYSEGCWCHPVRDAAKLAYNKLELDG